MIDISKNSIIKNKNYQSPIRFFESYNIDYSDFTRLRADFINTKIKEIFQQTSTKIILDDIAYSEQELINEISSPEFENHLSHHSKIWNTKWLLKFLEKGTVQLRIASRQKGTLVDDPNFVAFISPYFITPYQNQLMLWINEPSFESANRWLTFIIFMTEEDQKKSMLLIKNFLITSTKLFKSLTFTDSQSDSLRAWTQQNWYLLMNSIPSYLYEYRNDLSREILMFIERIAQTDLETAFLIALRLSKVEYLDQQIAINVHQYHQALSDVYYKKLEIERGDNFQEEEDSKSSPLGTIIGVISFIITLIGMVSKCS